MQLRAFDVEGPEESNSRTAVLAAKGHKHVVSAITTPFPSASDSSGAYESFISVTIIEAD